MDPDMTVKQSHDVATNVKKLIILFPSAVFGSSRNCLTDPDGWPFIYQALIRVVNRRSGWEVIGDGVQFAKLFSAVALVFLTK